ncbi:ubiquitin carboxyl-terminal hydrolase [Rhizopus stolonifer]|uniref:ubiquitinyl hydrolase 1 n=1 Tax=Rhizopus stolonifer TaxID=4846 RepID=A0A367KWY7_RHIST|nr:ubiquitin carboxyl-terminal hydrolase [Rhizopus stolonifer]
MALGNSPFIYKVHHAYTASQHQNDPRMIDMDTENLKNTEDLIEVANYHYVSYIYKNGHVWELDGLKGRPIKLSECDEATWLDALKPILEERMNASNDEGIAFNLMAVIHDSLSSKKAEANTYQDCIDQIEQVKEFESQAAQAHKDGFFSKYLNNNLTGYPVMQELWDARIQQEESTITEKATKLNELKDSVQDEIKIVETDNDVIMADVCRLKTDYFPFIEELLRAAMQKMVDDLNLCNCAFSIINRPKNDRLIYDADAKTKCISKW